MDGGESAAGRQGSPDIDAVRAALAGDDSGAGAGILRPEDIADVVVDGDRVVVVLAVDSPSNELMARVHRRLSDELPRLSVEVRAHNRIHRGGAGFGEGRHVVAVLGGKGGVGKSTVAVNLALTLSAMGVRAGLLDADINAPDLPHMLGVHSVAPSRRAGWSMVSRDVTPRARRRTPQQRYGVEVMSVGFEVPERFAPRITSRLLVSTLLRSFIFDVAWTADVLVVDAPPGTGEELQVIAAELPLSGAIFVTTPQDLAQMDAERTLALLAEHAVPVIGVVKNMASMRCPHCERDIDMFATSTRLADAGVRALGEIPFDLRLAAGADRGVPLVLSDPRGAVAYEFARMAGAVRRWLAEHPAAQG